MTASLFTPTVRIMTITPEIAAEWLNRNRKNRKFKEANCLRIRGAIERGEWHLNNDAIVLDIYGNIINGQHRLTACRDSGISIEAIVLEGMPPENQIDFDTGAKRTLGDNLSIRGEHDTNNLAAAIHLIWAWERGVMQRPGGTELGGFGRPSHRQAMAFLDVHPEINESVKRVGPVRKRVHYSPSYMALAHWLFSNIDSVDCDYFFDRLTDGVGLERGSPILHLRDQLIANATTQAKRTSRYMFALMIKAWNAYREGRSIQVLHWRVGGSAPEAFPRPV